MINQDYIDGIAEGLLYYLNVIGQRLVIVEELQDPSANDVFEKFMCLSNLYDSLSFYDYDSGLLSDNEISIMAQQYNAIARTVSNNSRY